MSLAQVGALIAEVAHVVLDRFSMDGPQVAHEVRISGESLLRDAIGFITFTLVLLPIDLRFAYVHRLLAFAQQQLVTSLMGVAFAIRTLHWVAAVVILSQAL